MLAGLSQLKASKQISQVLQPKPLFTICICASNANELRKCISMKESNYDVHINLVDNVSVIVVESTLSLEDFLKWCNLLQWPSCLVNVPIALPSWIYEGNYLNAVIPSQHMHPFEFLKAVSGFGKLLPVCNEETLSLNDSMIQSTITRTLSVTGKSQHLNKYSQFHHSNHTLISDIAICVQGNNGSQQLTSNECLSIINEIDIEHLRDIVQINIKNKYKWT